VGSGTGVAAHPVAQLTEQVIPTCPTLQHPHRPRPSRAHSFHTIYDRFGNLFRKAASNPTTGQENPLPYTAIETSDIDPAKNRFTSGTGSAYDDGGQIVTDNKFRALGLAYDANGRMVVSSQANQPDAVSVYDALGNSGREGK